MKKTFSVEALTRRENVEKAPKESEHNYTRLLAHSLQTQEQLRYFCHQALRAQEEERKVTSTFCDDVAQTLTGINFHLATLSREAAVNSKELKKKITHTKRLVENAVTIVHRFARELRPASTV